MKGSTLLEIMITIELHIKSIGLFKHCYVKKNGMHEGEFK